MRVISLTCSNTEIVCALGLSHLLVGVDDHSDFPVDVVAALPRVGPDLGIDVEAVARLSPDLVLASLTVPGHEAVLANLDDAGLRYTAPEPVSIADMLRDIRDIAALLGHPERGTALADELQAELEVPVSPGRRPSVLVEWWPKPVIVPGRDSWVTELIDRAGGRNPLADDPCKSRPVTDMEVVAMAPDAVVICWCGVPFERYRPDIIEKRLAWANTPALMNGQIHCIPEAFLGRPGPRLVDGLRALRNVVDTVR